MSARAGQVHISRLTAAHAGAYRSLMLEAYEQAADAFTTTAQERAAEPEAWWSRRIADPLGKGVAFGAFYAHTLVGTVALEYSFKPKTKHKAVLLGMYVLPSCRGRGTGKALVEAALQHAQARAGTLVLTLTVTQGNSAAINLYRVLGFEVFGTEPMAILTPSGFKAKLHMWRAVENTGANDHPPP